MSRANGEGSIYDTIQKIKKKFDNSNMCKICSAKKIKRTKREQR